MTAAPHIPVMLDEVLAALRPAPDEVYVDGTFGAGGYTRAILDAAPCRVIAIDRDPDAIAAGREMERAYAGRLVLVEGRFSEMEELVANAGHDRIDGVTLDLGISSMQVDRAERGFSFARDGALDMRMSQSGETAADLVNRLPEAELADIIYQYGEERRSRAIARAIVAARQLAPIERTLALADIVARVVGHGGRTHPATKTFQALRIYLNREVEELRAALLAAERLLAAAGRLVIVSFQSIDDREVKQFLAERSGRVDGGSRHRPAPVAGRAPTFKLLRGGAQKPGPAEVSANPRARSARLRAAVRTEAPAWGEAA
jgi:16S rRNA (cytosine1402-N4)-methyltransferase